MDKINLTIDGRPVQASAGVTVLEAARAAGIEIPTICDHEALKPYGACRMCVVEIDGVRGYPTSCTTPASEGMVVRTQTEPLRSLRSRILELMLSGHPNACLVCDHRELCEKYRPKTIKAGRTTRCGFCSNRDDCSLRNLALQHEEGRELNLPTLYSAHNVERYDPFMDRDYNLCILCGRCWRICEKIHGKPAISIINRGRWARLGTSFHKSHVHSGCTFCGSCIDICPTGTLTDRYARWYGHPDREIPSACVLCPEGCSCLALTKSRRIIANRMTDFTREASLCAVGRFAYAQIVNSPDRLKMPMVREDGNLIPVPWDEALASASEGLAKYRGAAAFLVSETCSREDRYLYEQLARAMDARIGFVPAGMGGDALTPQSVKTALDSGEVKAALVTGDFLNKDQLCRLEYRVVIDGLPSAATETADVILPAAVLSEVAGTYRNAAGEIKSFPAVTPPPGSAEPEWRIVSNLASAMGFKGFELGSAGEITPKIVDDSAPAPFPGTPRQKVADIPTRYRGHLLADFVCVLESLGLPTSPVEPLPEGMEGGFLILQKTEVIPNFHLIKIQAPQVARYAKPGQFVILMARETSERVPFTLIDWDAEQGSITVVIEEVGRSSREIAAFEAGRHLAHVTGPLGMEMVIEKKGTVVLGGGCYGIGGIYPIARAMKEAGNHVIGIIEASSDFLLYMEEEMASVCDELHIATKDGSRGRKGGVQEVFTDLMKQGVSIDQLVAIGCTFMMRMVAEATKPYGVPTYVALNPIMVDGTGMCGACRVSVGEHTRFACVDGPIFDGHAVDWDELFSRRSAYAREEIEALPQNGELLKAAGANGSNGGHTCGCGHHAD
jgi:NAD(P)H-flavin reductase/ferredoxin/Fe-S-cluster-containing hydrogenase component 2